MTPLERTSIHEAGHAVSATRLGVLYRSVTIVPTADAWGRIRFGTHLRHTDTMRAVRVLLAGPEAVRRKGGYMETGRVEGMERDYAHVAALLTTDTRRVAGTPMYELMTRLEHLVAGDVRLWWRDIETVAGALLNRKTLLSSEVGRLVEHTTKGCEHE